MVRPKEGSWETEPRLWFEPFGLIEQHEAGTQLGRDGPDSLRFLVPGSKSGSANPGLMDPLVSQHFQEKI